MISIFARTIIIYILLTISLKAMGKRQIGELDISELVSTLLISEIAAIPIDDPDLPLMNAIIPMLFILSIEIIISHLKTKHNKLKKYIEGEPTFLIFKGEIKQKALKESRISINEFLSEMRTQGIGNIKEIEYALIEQNGKISILQTKQSQIAHPIIIDGEINTGEMEMLNLNTSDIEKLLSKNNITLPQVFLLTLNDNNETNIILKEEK